MPDSIGDLKLNIILEILNAEKNAKKFSASLRDVEVSSNKAKEATVKLGDKIQGAGLRVDGFRAILDVLKSTYGSLINEYNKSEIALAKLSNGLKNVGEGAESLNKLSKQASDLQLITPFADEDIANAQAMLTTFQKNSDEISILTPRILDLAAAYQTSGQSGMDLQQVAVLLGKVNEETIGGLRRVGVAFSKEQEEKLKSLKGTEQAIYLAGILDSNFKGMAETVGNTAAGQLKIFDNKLSDVRESLGKILSDALIPLIKPLGDFLITISDADQPTKILTVSVIGLAGAFALLNTSMGGIPYIIGAVITVLYNIYNKFKETGSLVRATESDFSSFGSTVMTIMQNLLFPILQVKLAIWAVKRAIDDTIVRWNAFKTGEYGKVFEPGIHELPDPNEMSEQQEARRQSKSFKEVIINAKEEKKVNGSIPKSPGKSPAVKEIEEQISRYAELQKQNDEIGKKLLLNAGYEGAINDLLEQRKKIENEMEYVRTGIDLEKIKEESKDLFDRELKRISDEVQIKREQTRSELDEYFSAVDQIHSLKIELMDDEHAKKLAQIEFERDKEIEAIKQRNISEEQRGELIKLTNEKFDKEQKNAGINLDDFNAAHDIASQIQNILQFGSDTLFSKFLSALQVTQQIVSLLQSLQIAQGIFSFIGKILGFALAPVTGGASVALAGATGPGDSSSGNLGNMGNRIGQFSNYANKAAAQVIREPYFVSISADGRNLKAVINNVDKIDNARLK